MYGSLVLLFLLAACSRTEKHELLYQNASESFSKVDGALEKRLHEQLVEIRYRVANTDDDVLANKVLSDAKGAHTSYLILKVAKEQCRKILLKKGDKDSMQAAFNLLVDVVDSHKAVLEKVCGFLEPFEDNLERIEYELLLGKGDLSGREWRYFHHSTDRQLLLSMIHTNALQNTLSVLARLNQQVSSGVTCGLIDRVPLVKTSKNAYRVGEKVEARLFLSFTEGIEIVAIKVDGVSVELKHGYGLYETIAGEKGAHKHEVLFEVSNKKTGKVDPYPTAFDYYVY